MLLDNIKAEQAAIQNYRRTIAKLTNQSIIETVECIIADEEVHIATFAVLLKYYLKFGNENLKAGAFAPPFKH